MVPNYVLLKLMRYYSNLPINPKMRAWQIYKYGDISQLRLSTSYQTPTITQPNQVLVKVKAASINPIDVHLISGYGASVFHLIRNVKGFTELPITLGRDFSGTVIKVGRNVKSFIPGMDVIGALWPHQNGSHADYVVCCYSQLAAKPLNLSHDKAASIPYAGLTAYSALVEFGGLRARNGPEKRVLILGGSGGVGSLAVQIAKSLNAHVTVTCREHSEEMLLKLGVDVILSHNRDCTSETKYDIIFDCIGEDVHKYTKLLKSCPSSRFVTIKHPFLQITDKYSPYLGVAVATFDFMKTFVANAFYTNGAMYQWGFFRSSGTNLGILSRMVDEGRLVPIIQEKFDFDKIPDAYATLVSGSMKGKVVVMVD